MKTFAIVAAFTVGLSSTAQAGWQNTAWGMAPELVKAKVAGARDATPEERSKHGWGKTEGTGSSLVVAPSTIGALQFTAYFDFSAGLSVVTLDLDKPANCDDVLTAVKSRYGTPLSEEIRNDVGIAIWLKNADQITLVWVGPQWGSPICSLRYQPSENPLQKASPSDPGLQAG